MIANSVTASSVTPLTFNNVARDKSEGAFMVRRVRLSKDSTTTAAAKFRLHLFETDPTLTDPTNGDNGAFKVTDVLNKCLGSFDFDMTTAPDINTDGVVAIGIPMNGSESLANLATGTAIYGLMEARDAYAPASGEKFTVILEVIQN